MRLTKTTEAEAVNLFLHKEQAGGTGVRKVPHGPQMPLWAACPWLRGLEAWPPMRAWPPPGAWPPAGGVASEGACKDTSTWLAL